MTAATIRSGRCAATCGVWLSAHLMEHYRFTVGPGLPPGPRVSVARRRGGVRTGDARRRRRGGCSSSRRLRRSTTSSCPPVRRHRSTSPSTYDIWLIRELFAQPGRGRTCARVELVVGRAGRRLLVIGCLRSGSTPDGRLMEWPTDWEPSEPRPPAPVASLRPLSGRARSTRRVRRNSPRRLARRWQYGLRVPPTVVGLRLGWWRLWGRLFEPSRGRRGDPGLLEPARLGQPAAP